MTLETFTLLKEHFKFDPNSAALDSFVVKNIDTLVENDELYTFPFEILLRWSKATKCLKPSTARKFLEKIYERYQTEVYQLLHHLTIDSEDSQTAAYVISVLEGQLCKLVFDSSPRPDYEFIIKQLEIAIQKKEDENQLNLIKIKELQETNTILNQEKVEMTEIINSQNKEISSLKQGLNDKEKEVNELQKKISELEAPIGSNNHIISEIPPSPIETPSVPSTTIPTPPLPGIIEIEFPEKSSKSMKDKEKPILIKKFVFILAFLMDGGDNSIDVDYLKIIEDLRQKNEYLLKKIEDLEKAPVLDYDYIIQDLTKRNKELETELEKY